MVSRGQFFHTFRILNALSIDVALGASIICLFLASLLQISLSLVTLLSLSATVWLIYTIDHLVDARKIQHPSHTFRHALHQKYLKTITRLAAFVALGQAFLLFFLPVNTLLWGIFLLFVVIGYFLILWSMQFNKIYHKELLIAIVYTSGIFLPILTLKNSLTFDDVFLFCQVFMLALANLLLFSLIEVQSDSADKQPSLVLLIGRFNTRCIVVALLIAGVGISVVKIMEGSYFKFQTAQLTFILMNIVLGLTLTFPKAWKEGDLHRVFGDAIFFIPLGYLFMAQ